MGCTTDVSRLYHCHTKAVPCCSTALQWLFKILTPTSESEQYVYGICNGGKIIQGMCSGSRCARDPGLDSISWVTGPFASPFAKSNFNKCVCTKQYCYCFSRNRSTSFSVPLSFN